MVVRNAFHHFMFIAFLNIVFFICEYASGTTITIYQSTSAIADEASWQTFQAHYLQVDNLTPQLMLDLTTPGADVTSPLVVQYQTLSGHTYPLPLPGVCLHNLLSILQSGLTPQENEITQCHEFASMLLTQPMRSLLSNQWLSANRFSAATDSGDLKSGMPLYVFSPNTRKTAGRSKHMGIYLGHGLVIAKLVSGSVFVTDIDNFKALYHSSDTVEFPKHDFDKGGYPDGGMAY